jgi:hypothetical protein
MEAVPMMPVIDSNRIALHHTIGHYNYVVVPETLQF